MAGRSERRATTAAPRGAMRGAMRGARPPSSRARVLAAVLCAAALGAFRAAPHHGSTPPALDPIALISADEPSVPSARRFGDRVAAKGCILAIAAPTDGDDAWSPGSVLLHRLEWRARGALEIRREAEFSSSPSAAGEHFGSALAVSAGVDGPRGAVVAVGASRADVSASRGQPVPMAGAVDLFERSKHAEPMWRHVARLVALAPQPGAEFGGTLAFDARGAARLAVGAPRYDARAHEGAPWTWDAGQVHVFTRHRPSTAHSVHAGEWLEVAVIDSPDPQPSDWFGAAIALEGDLLAIGSPGRDLTRETDGALIPNAGAVLLYRRIDDGERMYGVVPPAERYRLERVLTAPLPEHSAWFGQAVALAGNTLAVGAPRARGLREDGASAEPIGCVHLFDLASPDRLPERIDPPSALVVTGFGQTLALEGRTLVVGAPTTGAIAPGSGGSIVRDVGGTWVYALGEQSVRADLRPPDLAPSVLFGATAALAEPEQREGAGQSARPSTAQAAGHGFARRQMSSLVAIVGHRYTEEESTVPSPGAAIYAVPRVRAPP